MIDANTNDIYNELKKYASDDYQNRDGNYPKSNVPDTIEVDIESIECIFKNTPEHIARKWLIKLLRSNNFVFDEYDVATCQDGDYYDDWVKSYISLSKIKVEKYAATFLFYK